MPGKRSRQRCLFEADNQQARAFQNSPQFQPYRQMRQTAGHRLARLVQLGIRLARYFGREQTLFQLLMAATVANLTLIATKTGQMRTKIAGFRLNFQDVLSTPPEIFYPRLTWTPSW